METQFMDSFKAEHIGPLIQTKLAQSGKSPDAFRTEVGWSHERFDAVVERNIGPISRDECERVADAFGLRLDHLLNSTETPTSPPKDPPGTIRRVSQLELPEDFGVREKHEPEEVPVLKKIREYARANLILLVKEHPTLYGSHIGPMIGMSKSFFSNLKNDNVSLTMTLIKKLEEALGLPKGWLSSKNPDRSVLENLQSPDCRSSKPRTTPAEELRQLFLRHPEAHAAYYDVVYTLSVLEPDELKRFMRELAKAVQNGY